MVINQIQTESRGFSRSLTRMETGELTLMNLRKASKSFMAKDTNLDKQRFVFIVPKLYLNWSETYTFTFLKKPPLSFESWDFAFDWHRAYNPSISRTECSGLGYCLRFRCSDCMSWAAGILNARFISFTFIYPLINGNNIFWKIHFLMTCKIFVQNTLPVTASTSNQNISKFAFDIARKYALFGLCNAKELRTWKV